MPERIDARRHLSDAEAAALGGRLLDDSAYDRVVVDDAEVFKPDGSPLLVFRRNAIPAGPCKAAYESLRTASFDGGNRGLASGLHVSPAMDARFLLQGQARAKRIKKDGTLSNTSIAVGGRNQKTSAIVGAFDRNARYPYCRLTAFNLDHPERFEAALPFIRAVDAVFAREVPDRHAAQLALIGRTSPDFTIHGTAFTTITVNRNWQTAVHQDKGDYRPGFGVMTVLRAGRYDGGFLIFPQFRVAVDMRSRDVLLADVHEWHGNSPLAGAPGRYERISCVFYYREGMRECGAAAEERERAKRRRPGQRLKGP